MKNVLEYYYNLLNITVCERNNRYYFLYNGEEYVFFSISRNIEEVSAIYYLSKNLEQYNQIILNREHSPVTYYNHKFFVLMQLKYSSNEEISFNDLRKKNAILSKDFEVLYRNNWIDLIIKKIDYIEYQREHLSEQYPLLNETLDYYIGMTESAISYFNNNISSDRDSSLDRLGVSHKRINSVFKNEFYNPLNIVIDHQARDVSGYLKYLFIKDKYNLEIVREVIQSISFSKYGYSLLFGRMLYPSIYFDVYERIVNEGIGEEEIVFIVKRSREYEQYLKLIFDEINTKIKIPSVDWI